MIRQAGCIEVSKVWYRSIPEAMKVCDNDYTCGMVFVRHIGGRGHKGNKGKKGEREIRAYTCPLGATLASSKRDQIFLKLAGNAITLNYHRNKRSILG